MQPEDFRERANVSRETFHRFETYYKLLLKWQNAINLVSHKTLQTTWERHFWDSAQLQPHICENAQTIVDLGSGAGFPGMILALLYPNKEIHMIESDERKCEFLKNVLREICDENHCVVIHNDRIENIIDGLLPDIITARAFASLENIITVTKPVWQQSQGLQLVLLKGQKIQKEIEEAQTKYRFDHELHPSQSHDTGYILKIFNIKDAG